MIKLIMIKNVENEQPTFSHQQRSPTTPFCFYETLGYPIPTNQTPFSYDPTHLNASKENQHKNQNSDALLSPLAHSNTYSSSSRSTKNPYLEDFLHFIQKYEPLYRQLPFIHAIYLANSITFNALKSSSDIDLFIITEPKRLRLARLRISGIMLLFHIKRTKSKSCKKFCLSFFIDTNSQNLEPLLLSDHDLYLPYRISHLVPLYLQNGQANIYSDNLRIQRFLPNRTPQQHIFLKLPIVKGRGAIKAIVEILHRGWRGNFCEWLVQKFRFPLINYKTKKNPDLHKGIITTKSILKFHHDKRQHYSNLIFGKKSHYTPQNIVSN